MKHLHFKQQFIPFSLLYLMLFVCLSLICYRISMFFCIQIDSFVIQLLKTWIKYNKRNQQKHIVQTANAKN